MYIYQCQKKIYHEKEPLTDPKTNNLQSIFTKHRSNLYKLIIKCITSKKALIRSINLS